MQELDQPGTNLSEGHERMSSTNDGNDRTLSSSELVMVHSICLAETNSITIDSLNPKGNDTGTDAVDAMVIEFGTLARLR